MTRFHHKLGEVPLVPTWSLTFLGLSIDSQTMSLSLPEKKILDIQNKMSKPHSQSHYISSHSGKPHRDIGSSPPCHLAGPPTLQSITNTAHKIPTGFSGQLRDTGVLKQQYQWWLHNIATVIGNTIDPPAPEVYITSDASKAGVHAAKT